MKKEGEFYGIEMISSPAVKNNEFFLIGQNPRVQNRFIPERLAKGVFYFDEYSTIPNYKWYRNPIKWWGWHRLWKKVGKHYGRTK